MGGKVVTNDCKRKGKKTCFSPREKKREQEQTNKKTINSSSGLHVYHIYGPRSASNEIDATKCQYGEEWIAAVCCYVSKV